MTRVVEGPVTEAGRTILAKLSRTPYIALADPRLAILAIEAAARAEAGHRIPEPHDCFLMNCARLGDELRRMGAAYVEMQRLHIELGDEMADRIAAARAEVIAEIRAGVEGDEAAEAAHDAWYAEKRRRLAAGGFADSWLSETGEEQLVPWVDLSEPVRDFDRIVVRAAVLALLPPTEPKT